MGVDAKVPKEENGAALKLLLSREEIREGVERLSGEINRDYTAQPLLLVALLKGSFVFLADLMRLLALPVEVDFVQLSSYGSAMESQGRVKLRRGLTSAVAGRSVLVVEDIVDTGLTLAYLLEYLRKRKPSSLKVCVLFDKPERRKVSVPIDYLGFTVPNQFLVGYGVDWDEKYRHLPDLWMLQG